MKMTTITEEALLHYEFLISLSKHLEIGAGDARRLMDIANGLRFRPELNMAEDFRFEVGKVYPTREGKLVRIIDSAYLKSEDLIRGYECVQGDDGDESNPDAPGGWRYNRSTGTYDAGRVTGSPDDTPRNLLPIEITDERVLYALGIVITDT